MFKIIRIVAAALLLSVCFFSASAAADASTSTVRYTRGRIVRIERAQRQPDKVTVTVLNGKLKGETFPAAISVPPGSFDSGLPVYHPGDVVLLGQQISASGSSVFVVIDHYRISFAIWLLLAIVLLAIVFAGWRGIGSLVGLVLSTAVLAGFVIPQILQGHNAYEITAIGILVISSVGIFIAHGFSKRTALALLSTYATLILAVLLSIFAVKAMHLTGVTDEDTFYLSQAKPFLNIQGLLLCGILVSLVGILDDITVGQATSVEELYKANPLLSVRSVYSRALKIGREHIASLIHTLVLVFIGTSFLLVTYLSALSPYPWYVNLNSGLIMQEIVRGLVGSLALIIAVPITTIVAARFLHPKQAALADPIDTADTDVS